MVRKSTYVVRQTNKCHTLLEIERTCRVNIWGYLYPYQCKRLICLLWLVEETNRVKESIAHIVR